MGTKIRVLIIDDSALVRQMLTELLGLDPAIEVVGVAQDPYIAREKIKELNPDVLTLDVEMPRMDGITFLGNLMRLRPTPVVMVSSLTEKGAEITLEALALGAVDFVSKPRADLAHTLQDYAAEIIAKVKVAARVNLRRVPGTASASRPGVIAPKLSVDAILPRRTLGRDFSTTDKLIAIGASTGGTEAIREVLMDFPADAPGTVVTQHIPAAFSRSFAERLDKLCAIRVQEAEDRVQVLPGHAYIAPGGRHLRIERNGARFICRLDDGPPVNRHKPSVDVLFRSVMQSAGRNTVGVLLTGMGDDGARGLKEIRDAGAWTIAQDEASSVVWGMPGEAVKLGAAQSVLPLGCIAREALMRIRALDAGPVRLQGGG